MKMKVWAVFVAAMVLSMLVAVVPVGAIDRHAEQSISAKADNVSSNLKIDVSISWEVKDHIVWLYDTTSVTSLHQNTTYWWKSESSDDSDKFRNSSSTASGETKTAIVGKVSLEPSGTGFLRPYPHEVRLSITVVDLKTGETLRINRQLEVPSGLREAV